MGTPLYMAPEQLRAEPLDGRADQFAWGVLAYELLSGAAPWKMDGGAISVVAQILSATPTPLAEAGHVPAIVAATIERAMQKDREARFPSMEALLDALAGKSDPTAKVPAARPVATAIAMLATERAPAETPAKAAPNATPPEAPAPPPPPLVTTAAGTPEPTRQRTPRARTVALSLAAAVVGVAALVALRSQNAARVPTSVSTASIAPPGCTGHRACVDAHGGAPWACNPTTHACVAIASEDCTAKIDPKELRSDDMVWLGAMLPLTGRAAEVFGKQAAQVLELARRDFASVGGIPGVREGEMRPLGLVLCDDKADAHRAANHLTDIGVPAVLGFGVPLTDVIDLTRTVFLPKRTLVFDMFHESPLVTRIPQPAGTPRLVWRLTSSAAQSGEAVAHVISDHVEPWLRRAGGPLAHGEPTRLVILRSETAFAASVLDATATALRLNGKPLAENNGLFKQLTFSKSATPEKIDEIVADLDGFAPHVVAFADGYDFENTFVEAIERRWRAPYRPFYVSATMLDNPKLLAFVGANAERRRRFLSVELPANTDENFKFVLHYNAVFDPKITPGNAPGVVFDAFYVAAYAAAATRKATVGGIDMAEAMRRLGGDGDPIAVNASNIFAAYDVLRQDKTLRLAGAGTQLDFDHAAGEIPTDLAVYCMSVDLKSRASEPIESGLRYAHKTKGLVGKLECP